jgi:hypothetical protein
MAFQPQQLMIAPAADGCNRLIRDQFENDYPVTTRWLVRKGDLNPRWIAPTSS